MIRLTPRQDDIINIIVTHEEISISEIKACLHEDISMPTLNRDLLYNLLLLLHL